MQMIFKKLGKRSNLLVLFALFILLIFLLNYFMPRSLALDVHFAYSSKEAYGLLESMGPNLRANYLLIIWILDSAYMVTYLLFFSSLIIKVLNSKYLAALPLLIFTLDLIENVTVTILLLKYPIQSQVLGLIASFFTTTKWLSVGVFWIIFLACLVYHYVLKNQSDLDLNG
jgi:hypothetical protein